LTRRHKQTLKEYRENTIIKFDSLNSDVQLLDIENVFSDANLEISHQLSNDVFASSEECSQKFVEFSRSIIRSSTELLKGCQAEPPCNFAVVAMGSAARGEATPYSDLEYAFLIENEDEKDYFTQLAVETYFRITNLNESPLKTFNIKVENSPDCLTESCPVGYRIDGFTPNAGNIPTGNGLGKSLTFTVEQAVKLYKEEVMSPSGKLASISDLLMTSQLIYWSDDGAQLHHRFMEEITTYEKVTAQKRCKIKQKRLMRFFLDLKRYDFLPNFEFNTVIGLDVKVKEDIFRYITLLATNLNIALCLQLNFSWKVYEALYQSGIISKESLRYLHIILGLSIYMRTMAYITMETQKAEILLRTSTAEMRSGKVRSKHYYIPRNLFVTFGSILIPIKQSLISSIHKGNKLLFTLKRKSVSEYLKLVIPSDLVTDKNDYMTICEVLCYVQDSKTAFKYISSGSGADIRTVSYKHFVKLIRLKYNIGKSDYLEKKYIEMCCFLLIISDHDSSAIDYLGGLISYHTYWFNILQYKRMIGNCMKQLSQYKSAKNILLQIKSTLEEKFKIDKNKSLTEYILRKVAASTELPKDMLHKFAFTTILFQSLGEINYQSANLAEAEFYLMHSLFIHRLLLNKNFSDSAKEQKMTESTILLSLGIVHTLKNDNSAALKYFAKSIKMSKAVHGEHTNHPSIAASYGDIGNAHKQLGNYETALEYSTKSIEMMKAVYGEHTNHSHLAIIYSNIGDVHRQLGNYDTALVYYTKSMKIMKAVYGEHTNHSNTAISYSNIGDVHRQLGNYETALEYCAKSMEMTKAVYGEHTNHSNTAISYSNIGDVHRQLGNYGTALEYFTKSLEMMKAVYGEHTNHSNLAISYSNIGDVQRQLGNYDTALEYCTKSMEMMKALYGEHTNHSNLAISYSNIGDVHRQLGNYDTALEHYTKSMEMLKAVYGESSAHPNLVDAISSILNIYLYFNRYEDCLFFCYTPVLRNHFLSKVLNRISADYIRSSNYRRAAQFLQIAISKAGDHSMQQADNYHQMGKCYMLMFSYKKSWCWLYPALCLYQSFPKTREVIYLLGDVHLSIAHLLLHTGHVTQSLEHCQRSLDYFNNLPDVNTNSSAIKHLQAELVQLSDSLHLIKMLTKHF